MRCICILLMLLVSAYAFAQETGKGVYDETAQAIEKQILEKNKVKIENLKILHEDDSVYLEGVADVFGSRYEAGEIASKYQGIKSVDNQIAVGHSGVSDSDIETALIAKVRKHLNSGPFDLVSIQVKHGFVTLFGTVRDSSLKEEVFKEAIWIQGVRDVDNQIELTSVSVADDRLRLAIFNRLSREYPQYFQGSVPSIIILVHHGRVTMVGYVNSRVEKQKMISTIRSFSGVLSVVDRLESQ